MTPREVIPSSWTAMLRDGPLTWGLDLATSEKKTSNPSSLVVMEKWDGLFIERLVLEWKTKDEAVTRQIVGLMLSDLAATQRRFRCGCIDATNETFFAQQIKKQFAGRCTIHLVKGGEKLSHGVQEFDAKTLLGNMFVNAHTDGRIATPEASWIKDDRRLLKREKGKFDCDLGREGQHGDTFDAGKLALWGQLRAGGRAQAEAAPITDGSAAAQKPQRESIRNPYAHLHQRHGSVAVNL